MQDTRLHRDAQRQPVVGKCNVHALDRHVADRARKLLVQPGLQLRCSEGEPFGAEHTPKQAGGRQEPNQRNDDPGDFAS